MALELQGTRTDTIVIVRETVDEDNDPVGSQAVALTGCKIVARLPQPDQHTSGQRTVTTLDVRHPDRDVDVRATDRVRLAGEPITGRARWTVEGEPSRSPFDGGGCVFVLQREVG